MKKDFKILIKEVINETFKARLLLFKGAKEPVWIPNSVAEYPSGDKFVMTTEAMGVLKLREARVKDDDRARGAVRQASARLEIGSIVYDVDGEDRQGFGRGVVIKVLKDFFLVQFTTESLPILMNTELFLADRAGIKGSRRCYLEGEAVPDSFLNKKTCH